ncbi:MAG: DUF134 domain-containing protein [Bacteroidales bacterium]|nr:DUF134 domain-containing protein [Bacteroidales bacterium]
MTPRAKTPRRVLNLPEIKGFRPYGINAGKSDKPMVILFYEEVEALRLCDFDHHNHHEASELMGVSRPTFTRIYASALQKIATAFVEGRRIHIEGGHVYYDSEWFTCEACASKFNHCEKEQLPGSCPLCGSERILPVEFETDDERDNKVKTRSGCKGMNQCL